MGACSAGPPDDELRRGTGPELKHALCRGADEYDKTRQLTRGSASVGRVSLWRLFGSRRAFRVVHLRVPTTQSSDSFSASTTVVRVPSTSSTLPLVYPPTPPTTDSPSSNQPFAVSRIGTSRLLPPRGGAVRDRLHKIMSASEFQFSQVEQLLRCCVVRSTIYCYSFMLLSSA